MSLAIAVIGHVEHITLGRVAQLPGAGDIAHLTDLRVIAGGGGGVAFFQLARSSAEVHLFTAFGNDDAGRVVEEQVRATTARIHAVRRDQPHTRDVAMIDPGGDRTIVVIGEPLHPRADDPLPWDMLDRFDGVFFTARDPALLARCRRATRVVVAARRRDCIIASGIEVDAIVGSIADPRERAARRDYPIPPRALVMTDGGRGGTVETEAGETRFVAPKVDRVVGSYGAGDSFAAALTYFLAAGHDAVSAATQATRYGAAVLSSIDPLAAQAALP